jgi:hypothetical protein
MPRKKIDSESAGAIDVALADRLAEELRAERDSGQPLVYERELRPGRIRVIVIWDDWNRVPTDERVAIIGRAYEIAEGVAARDRIALASGLTVPEATASGMLPYQVGTALRKSDPVSFEECWQAMAAEGASKLLGPGVM